MNAATTNKDAKLRSAAADYKSESHSADSKKKDLRRAADALPLTNRRASDDSAIMDWSILNNKTSNK